MAKSKKSKKKNLKAYASIGLWFSGVFLLATVILLIIKLFSAAGIYTPPKWFNTVTLICACMAVLGLAVYALLNPQRVREFIAGRQVRHGSNTIIMLLAFLGILIVINVIFFQNPTDWDITQEKSHTLAPETIETLKALPTPVHAIAFYSQTASTDTARELLENFKSSGNNKFTYEFVDPDQNLALAKQSGISGDAKIFLQMEERHEIVATASEEDLTNALIRLMNPGQRTVYFLSGHGEHSIDESGETGYSRVKATLEAKNYTVKTLHLLTENQIPEDALAVIIAGPQKPVSKEEMTLLETYMENGGSLIIMEDPTLTTSFENSPDPAADYLARVWGITLNNDLVIDVESTNSLYAIGVYYSDSHPISKSLQGTDSVYPYARSLSISSGATDPVALVTTQERSWGETDFAALQAGQVSPDAGVDIFGPINLAVASSDYNTGARVVVFGDSDFAADPLFDTYANGDMLINSIDWAAKQDAMINLTPSGQSVDRQLKQISSTSLVIMGISFLCLMPLLVIAGGVAAWLARRVRG